MKNDFYKLKKELQGLLNTTFNEFYISTVYDNKSKINETNFLNERTYHSHVFREFGNLFIEIFDKVSCNPTKLKTKIKDKRYYIEVDSQYDTLGSKLVDIIDFHQTTLSRSGYSFVTGEKGIGKTSMINHYLNRISHIMSRKEHTIWIRIDMSKYEYNYKLWEHIYRQIIYVTARYYKKPEDGFTREKLFKGIYSKNDTFVQILFKNTKRNKTLAYLERDDLISKIKELENLYVKNDSRGTGIKPNLNEIYNEIEFIKIFAETIFEFMTERIKPIKIILILDGIDNIEYNDIRYKNFIRELSDVVTFNEKGQKFFHHCCIVCRKETYAEIVKYNNLDYNHAKSIMHQIEKISFENLMKKKLNFFKNYSNDNLTEEFFRIYNIKIEQSVFLDEIIAYIENFNKNLIDILQNIHTKVIIKDSDDILVKFFNNNLRYYIFCIFKSYTYIRTYAYYKYDSNNHKIDKITNALTKEFKESYLFKRLILESLFFGSEIYPTINNKDEYFGHMGNNKDFTNILSPLSIKLIVKKKSNFDILLTIRILQILIFNETNIELIQNKINLIYKNISKDLILSILNVLVQYGYIIQTFDEKEFVYRITSKGTLSYDIFWQNINIFYGYSTTAYIPIKLAEEMCLFENKRNEKWIDYKKNLNNGVFLMLAYLSALNEKHEKNCEDHFWKLKFVETEKNINNLLKQINEESLLNMSNR